MLKDHKSMPDLFIDHRSEVYMD